MSLNLFIGTWTLVSVESRGAGGELSHPFGDASGYLVYNQDGYMAVAIMQADRRNFATADMEVGDSEEKLAAFDTYFPYCGTFEVKGDIFS